MNKVLGTNYYTNNHGCFVLTYHLVLVTKYRHLVLKDEIQDDVYNITEELLQNSECRMLAINGEPDHMHVLFEASPEVHLCEIIRNIKTITARTVRRKYADLLQYYYDKPYFWSDSYFVSTVGSITKNTVNEYIKRQGTRTRFTPEYP